MSYGGLDGKVALIVGGASGMGNAVARQLVQADSHVHIFDIQETTDGVFHRCDIQDHGQIRDCVRRLVDQAGGIDLLFIAAGVHLFANIEDTSIEEFEHIVATNVKGPFYVLKEVLPVMREQCRGNIVMMGSDQVLIGKGNSAAYGMSKAAVGQLTKSTAIDYAPYDIRVNCICPGTIDTPMVTRTVERLHHSSGTPMEHIYDELNRSQPVQRMGTPDEIARVVLFLLSEDCPFMTGALVSADGGYTCQ